ncbi:MAG: hypothetical protein AAF628_38205 [Planctomycetota bacterium]
MIPAREMATIRRYCEILSKESRTGPASAKFMAWARQFGIPEEALRCFEACWVTQRLDGGIRQYGPLFHTTAIIRRTEKDPKYVSAGLAEIGACPNGDVIALDARSKKGAVVYISHEHYWGSELDPRDCLIRVARSLPDFAVGAERATLPMDYWEATEGG